MLPKSWNFSFGMATLAVVVTDAGSDLLIVVFVCVTSDRISASAMVMVAVPSRLGPLMEM